MSNLTNSAPPVQLGQVNARGAAAGGVQKHNSPLPSGAAAKPKPPPAAPLEKVAVGMDPLASRPPPAAPPIAVQSVQKAATPPVPGSVFRAQCSHAHSTEHPAY